MIDPISAMTATSIASEVRKASESQLSPPLLGAAQAPDNGASFAEVMSSMGTAFVDNLKAAETKSMDGMMGKASVREVVEAVMTADQSLQTALAFRDKVVSAYLEVIKMPI